MKTSGQAAQKASADMAAAPAQGTTSVEIGGARIELVERGSGRPLLFLHPGIGIEASTPVIDHLAADRRVIAPSHPGFGGSDLPPSMKSVDDLSYFYLDLVEALDLRDIALVGVSLGAWIAAEIAIKSIDRLSCLVLADAVGVKFGAPDQREIVDIFGVPQEELDRLCFHDGNAARRDYTTLSDEELLRIARNREAVARFGWSPYLHDPKLKNWLHRIRLPTLFLWGASDRIVTPDYGRAYCARLPMARFELIEKAGHYPHLEQPEEFARRVLAFTAETTRASTSAA
jgi:pimeloyl-ACP methyl ester carboxylesterase